MRKTNEQNEKKTQQRSNSVRFKTAFSACIECDIDFPDKPNIPIERNLTTCISFESVCRPERRFVCPRSWALCRPSGLENGGGDEMESKERTARTWFSLTASNDRIEIRWWFFSMTNRRQWSNVLDLTPPRSKRKHRQWRENLDDRADSYQKHDADRFALILSDAN